MRPLTTSLLAVILTGCIADSSGIKLEQPLAQKQEVPAPTAEPSPYQGLPLTRSQSRYLERALPKDVRHILEQAEEIEVISIDYRGVHSQQPAEVFMKVPALGKVKVTDSRVRRNLVDALFDGIATSGSQAACFIPHHGLRAKKGEEVVELLICFECRNFVGSAPSGEFGGPISRLPHEMFNNVLLSAGVPLSEK